MTTTTPIGVAMLGAAHSTHAWSYARALTASPLTRIVGIHDDDPESHRWIRQDFGVEAFADAGVLVDSPEVDAVVVCTPTARHRASVELAASRGCHVLCEKPLATTLDDARAMEQACADAGVQLHLAFVSRFLPLVARAREAVHAGRLGQLIGLVGCNRGRPPLPPGYPPWITDAAEAGGGALIDHSVHVSDVMRHMSGLEVVEVSAEAGSLLWDCGVDDVAVVLLRFDNAAVGSIDPSWSVPANNPWNYDFSLRLLGTEGSLEISDQAEALHVVSNAPGQPPGLRHVSIGEDADAAMIEAFARSVASGTPQAPSATGRDGVKALEVALAAYDSAASGAPVSLPR